MVGLAGMQLSSWITAFSSLVVRRNERALLRLPLGLKIQFAPLHTDTVHGELRNTATLIRSETLQGDAVTHAR